MICKNKQKKKENEEKYKNKMKEIKKRLQTFNINKKRVIEQMKVCIVQCRRKLKRNA